MIAWLVSAAWAGSPPPEPPPPTEAEGTFPRLDQELRVARYGRVDGEGPVRLRNKSKSGAIEAWTWPDGEVARFRVWKGKEVVEDRTFDAFGGPVADVHFASGAPVKVALADAAATDVSGWAAATVGPWTVRAPAAATDEAGVSVWTWDAGRFTARWLPPENPVAPFGKAFQDGLVASCGCVITARALTLVDGVPGARYLLAIPGPEGTSLAEIWAVRSPEGTLLATFGAAAAGEDLAGLAGGRAVAALLDRREPE